MSEIGNIWDEKGRSKTEKYLYERNLHKIETLQKENVELMHKLKTATDALEKIEDICGETFTTNPLGEVAQEAHKYFRVANTALEEINQ